MTIIKFDDEGQGYITEVDFRKFLEVNNLSVKIKKNWDDEYETSYTYQGYWNDKLIFDCNEFYIKKTVKFDVTGSEALDVITTLKHREWVYDMFDGCQTSYPMLNYVPEGFEFKKGGW